MTAFATAILISVRPLGLVSVLALASLPASLVGMSRRACLKGLGEAKGCPYPARAAFVQIKTHEDDVKELPEDRD